MRDEQDIQRDIRSQMRRLGLVVGEEAGPTAGEAVTHRAKVGKAAGAGRVPAYFELMTRCSRRGDAVLLAGQPGSYKTHSVHLHAAREGMELFVVQAHRYLGIEELRGTRGLSPAGGTTFEPGPLARSLEQDAFFLLDEITFADPGVIGALNNLLDGTGTLVIPETGQVIHRGPKWRFFATANPGCEGTQTLNEALLSRCVVIETRPDTDFELLLLGEAVPEVVARHGRAVRRIIEACRKARASSQIQFAIDIRSSIQFLRVWKDCGDPVEAFALVILPKLGQPPELFEPVREELLNAVKIIVSERT